MRDQLMELYRRQGVLSVEAGLVLDHPLHSSCPSANRCWGPRARNDSTRWWNRIQLAYVGPLYEIDPNRVLVVGLNLNQDGGLAELEWLVRYAQVALARGCKRVNFDNPQYAGTLLFHRVAVFAALLLRSDWQVEDGVVTIFGTPPDADRTAGMQRWPRVPLFDAGRDLRDVLHSVSLVEAVKCSPEGERSRPSDSMRSECPIRFLKQEIEILQPHWLLVIGKETLDLVPFDEPQERLDPGDCVACFRARVGGRVVNVMCVKHPAAPGGCSAKLVAQAANTLIASGLEYRADRISWLRRLEDSPTGQAPSGPSDRGYRTWRIVNYTHLVPPSARSHVHEATVAETSSGFEVIPTDPYLQQSLDDLPEGADITAELNVWLRQTGRAAFLNE